MILSNEVVETCVRRKNEVRTRSRGLPCWAMVLKIVRHRVTISRLNRTKTGHRCLLLDSSLAIRTGFDVKHRRVRTIEAAGDVYWRTVQKIMKIEENLAT